MGYSSVQFMGREATLQAFQNSDCSNWAVLQGKQFMFKYEGTSTAEAYSHLDELLKMVASSSGSEAAYTLRTYDYGDETAQEIALPVKRKRGASKLRVIKPVKVKAEKKRKIYESTPYDGSFNFQIFGQGQGPRTAQYREGYELRKEFDEMKILLQEILREREAEPEDEKMKGIAGMLNGLLDMPEIKSAIAGKVVQLFNGVSNKIGSFLQDGSQLGKIAGPTPTDLQPAPMQQPIQLPKEQVDKLNLALSMLVTLDPEFADHLYKLALVAEKDPALYKTLISMLNKI